MDTNETITVTIPRYTRVMVNKTGRVIELDNSRAPASSIEFGWNYGWEQKFNDSHSSITEGGKNPFQGTRAEFEDAIHEVTDDIESRFYAGTLGSRARRVEDPKKVAQREFARLAKDDPEQLAQMLRAVGYEVPTKKQSKKDAA